MELFSWGCAKVAEPGSNIFVSYKAEDRPRLAPLVAALEAQGFSLWWDQHISGGANWREEIEAHLDAADVVIVVWSERSTGPEGRFVRDEAGQAQEAGRYLPLTIDKVRPPLGFREIQALDLAGWSGDASDPRFKLLVDTIRNRLEGAPITRPSLGALSEASAPGVSRRRMMIGAGSVASLAMAGGAGWLLLRPAPANARVAVMPFSNLSGDAGQDYFAAGLSEEVRSALSRAGLAVMGRETTEAVEGQELTLAARRLDVSHILSGSVRRGADTVRVSTRLIDGASGVDLWSHDYERAIGDAVVIQTAIAERVADALEMQVGPQFRQAVKMGSTTNVKALDYYFRAEDMMHRKGAAPDTVAAYISLMDQALAEDPNFALALVNRAAFSQLLASVESREAELRQFPRSKADFDRALAIAPEFPIAYVRKADLLSSQLRLKDALEQLSRPAVSSSNEYTVMRAALLANAYYGPRDTLREGIERLVALNPLTPGAHHMKSIVLLKLGEDKAALDSAMRAAELSPESISIARQVMLANMMNDRPEAAMGIVERFPDDDELHFFKACLLGRLGRVDEATAIRDAIIQESGDFFATAIAYIEAQCGRTDAAFDWLDRAIELEDSGLVPIMRDEFLRPLRKDPRFLAVLKRVRFPIIDPGIGGA